MPVLFDEKPNGCIKIGLINNMSDEGLKATERQFISLLDSASGNTPVHLSFYRLPGVPRSDFTASHIGSCYSNIEELWDGHIDGLIVTGREPTTPNLEDEPYWESFTKVLAWAQENCHATIFSCLAAHAAILHMDGIPRIKRDDKVFGIFESVRVSNHRLTAGTVPHLRLPHSRWNGIPEAQLRDCGYKVLTHSAEAGVDTFIKQRKRLFLFFQGHPEYESETLLREYQRDVRRYIKGEVTRYPLIPRSYFDETTVQELKTLQERATARKSEDLLAELTVILANKRIDNTWHSSASGIYRNWLGHICSQKETMLVPRRLKAMADIKGPLGAPHPPRASEMQTVPAAARQLINKRWLPSESGKTSATVRPETNEKVCLIKETAAKTNLKPASLGLGDGQERTLWPSRNRPGKPRRSLHGD